MERRRLWVLVIAAAGLLVGLGAGRAPTAADAGPGRPGSAYADTVGTIAAGPPGLVDTRLQRSPEGGPGQQFRPAAGAVTQALVSGAAPPRTDTLRAVLEHTEHPERRGHILLRGPPPSA